MEKSPYMLGLMSGIVLVVMLVEVRECSRSTPVEATSGAVHDRELCNTYCTEAGGDLIEMTWSGLVPTCRCEFFPEVDPE